ncbi:MAG: hypothetical protein HC898_06275, partial [Phycisphaerales bacterium]|nr:hypothetical protein [Phycisphaerales bacterium]
MSELITEILEATRYPQTLHAMMVHLPIAIGILGPLLTLWLIMSKGKSESVRWLVVTVYALGVVSAVLAMQSGHAAAEQAGVTGQVAMAVHEHEEMGEKAWAFFAACATLIALSSIPWRPMRWGGMILGLLLSLFTFAWIAVAGHLGGMLVYEHG